MIGRDLGVGSNTPELQFGMRIADLRASAHVTEAGTTFYSSNIITAQSAVGDWSSNFFGVGPRLAITGVVPITGFWALDYSGGIAALFGDRMTRFSATTSAGSFAGDTNSPAIVFNADGWAALSYSFAQNFKVSGGIRADYYNAALPTFNIITGGLQNVDRLYWGPFVRLTGTF
jgi:hypothetical protein